MRSAELELHAMECLLLAREVPDPRQRRILQETGVSWLRVAEQVKQSQRLVQASSTRLPNIQFPVSSSHSASNRA
jgi:hypothetical protein